MQQYSSQEMLNSGRDVISKPGAECPGNLRFPNCTVSTMPTTRAVEALQAERGCEAFHHAPEPLACLCFEV